MIVTKTRGGADWHGLLRSRLGGIDDDRPTWLDRSRSRRPGPSGHGFTMPLPTPDKPRTIVARPNGTSAGGTMIVRAISARATRGQLQIGERRFPCALGRSGKRAIKREGDGATPIGRFPLRAILWRADREWPPRSGLPRRPIGANDGWCDEVRDRNYNRLVRHPYPTSAEHLAREDDLYDVVLVIGHNDRPRQRGCGSAIFMHVARTGYRPTAGCIALNKRDLRQVLATTGRATQLLIPG